jgi:hypothetical protein
MAFYEQLTPLLRALLTFGRLAHRRGRNGKAAGLWKTLTIALGLGGLSEACGGGVQVELALK